ncbi:hypothetical protein J2X69_004420 [Algoriphagus sp. 4150]|uniref:baseplate wedge protein 53 n=1 Tax=Algoriphagus sp. 4150 TaxID=2817756 RepID=UPI00285D24BE|nr:baseplate wedge protein 53 [Algoriphagus sp. 4150]MDR7132054.1 hypothetical protein [Algoriphagus sp. 4150]
MAQEFEIQDQSIKESATNDWFEKTIVGLSADQLTYETKTLDPQSREFYEQIATGNLSELMQKMTVNMQQYYFKEIINAFFTELFTIRKSKKPKKLAFDYKGKQIMIWVEIPENDEKMEDDIFLSEATANYKFSNTGFNLSATIVEDSDKLPIPPHYINFEFQKV